MTCTMNFTEVTCVRYRPKRAGRVPTAHPTMRVHVEHCSSRPEQLFLPRLAPLRGLAVCLAGPTSRGATLDRWGRTSDHTGTRPTTTALLHKPRRCTCPCLNVGFGSHRTRSFCRQSNHSRVRRESTFHASSGFRNSSFIALTLRHMPPPTHGSASTSSTVMSHESGSARTLRFMVSRLGWPSRAYHM